jgi:hypothetical protein
VGVGADSWVLSPAASPTTSQLTGPPLSEPLYRWMKKVSSKSMKITLFSVQVSLEYLEKRLKEMDIAWEPLWTQIVQVGPSPPLLQAGPPRRAPPPTALVSPAICTRSWQPLPQRHT